VDFIDSISIGDGNPVIRVNRRQAKDPAPCGPGLTRFLPRLTVCGGGGDGDDAERHVPERLTQPERQKQAEQE